jgi:2-iminobutanoate/2-iminopropanoate deaminase
MKKIIHTSKAPEPIGPYNQAVLAGNLLFVSGQVPVNPSTGKIDSKDIQHQAKQVLENVKAVVEQAGLEMENIIKASIFITDMGNFAKVNEVYGQYFKKDEPARECIQVAGLPLGADVEISVIAVK